MTSADSMLPADARQGSPFAAPPPSRWDWIESRLSRISEYFNPILVKETRQALKSRQFLITFCLFLIAGWGFSLIYVAARFPAIYYAPQGSSVLFGYYVILCVPMIIIIPFVAFRSLSAEREDGTFDLVSITSLSPRQIVAGKLVSAIVQMLIYLSALAPGMVFTYMLRGVDIMMIMMSVSYLFLASIALSVLGLVLATVTSSRSWQMVLGVIFILALVVLFIISLWAGGFSIFEGAMAYDEPLFWAAHLFVVTIVVAYTVLFYLAAMARVTFVSDNRSTKIRTCLLVMQALAVGWATYFWLASNEHEVLIAFLVWAGFHWWLMGALMVGESDEISPRVRRELPETFMGRAFATWLYPGPGTGYMLTVACFGCLTMLVIAVSIGSVVAGSLATAAEFVQSSLVMRIALIAMVLVFTVAGAAISYGLRNQPTAVALFASFFFAIAAGSALLFLVAVLVPADLYIDEEPVLTAIFLYCYIIIYLGITRLAMMLFNRFVQGGIFLSALLSILFVLMGTFAPIIIDRMLAGAGLMDTYMRYTALQVPNPFWTSVAIVEHDLTNIAQTNIPLEVVLIVPVAGLALVINLLLSAREVDRQREATPDRVLEEERAVHPQKLKAEEMPSSPWDDRPQQSES